MTRLGRSTPQFPIRRLKLTAGFADFTDGLGAVGTYTPPSTYFLPAGAKVLATKIVTSVAFSGDTSAVATVGKAGATDDYFGSAASVFAAGTDYGQPATEAEDLVAADTVPIITVTSGADWGAVNPLAAMTVEITYLDLGATS